jgi:hypothetical protein
MTAMVAMHKKTAATVFTASALDSSSVMLAGEVTGDVMETFCGEGNLINISGHQEKQAQNLSGGGNHSSPAPAGALLAYPKKLKRTARKDKDLIGNVEEMETIQPEPPYTAIAISMKVAEACGVGWQAPTGIPEPRKSRSRWRAKGTL